MTQNNIEIDIDKFNINGDEKDLLIQGIIENFELKDYTPPSIEHTKYNQYGNISSKQNIERNC